MPFAPLALIALAIVLALCAARLHRSLLRAHDRLKRPLAILMGGLIGVAASIPPAIVLDRFVGLQSATFFNLMILVMCLGFLGLVLGSLVGLLYGGMVLGEASRTTHASVASRASKGAGATEALSSAAAGEKPRGLEPGEGRAPSFSEYMAQAERAQHLNTDPGGEA